MNDRERAFLRMGFKCTIDAKSCVWTKGGISFVSLDPEFCPLPHFIDPQLEWEIDGPIDLTMPKDTFKKSGFE